MVHLRYNEFFFFLNYKPRNLQPSVSQISELSLCFILCSDTSSISKSHPISRMTSSEFLKFFCGFESTNGLIKITNNILK